MEVVLDCSAALCLCMPDERGAKSDGLSAALAQAVLVVPPLWHYEVANSLGQAVKRGRIATSDLPVLLADILSLKIGTVWNPVDTVELARLAVETNLSAYDCAYLLLALQRGAAIGTLDARLGEVAKASGVDVVQFA